MLANDTGVERVNPKCLILFRLLTYIFLVRNISQRIIQISTSLLRWDNTQTDRHDQLYLLGILFCSPIPSTIPSFDFVASIFHTRFRNTKCAPILSRNSNILIFMMFSPSQLSYRCNCSLSLHTYTTPSGTKMYVGRRINQIIGAPYFAHPICENLNPLHISLIIWT